MSIIDPPNTLTPVTESATNSNNALIGYDNLLTQTTTIDARKALIPNTYERYAVPASESTVKFQLSTPSEVNYFAIAAHNLGTHDGGVTITVKFATVIGGSLATAYRAKVPNNKAMMVPLNLGGAIVAEIELTFNSGTLGAELGVFYEVLYC